MFAEETKRVDSWQWRQSWRQRRLWGMNRADVSAEKCGYDIESHTTQTGRLGFIEVKGRVEGAETVTVTRDTVVVSIP
jgi:hypothetical protein